MKRQMSSLNDQLKVRDDQLRSAIATRTRLENELENSKTILAKVWHRRCG